MRAQVSGDPDATLARFMEAHGPKVIEAAYGRSLAHRTGEQHWDFYEGEAIVGWGAITKTAPDRYSYRAGVFPEHGRRGYRRRIREFLAGQAFQNPYCRYLTTTALLSNPEQINRLVGEGARGEWGVPKRVVYDPTPELEFELTRERFERRG